MATAFISHPDCLLHEMGAGHPESPARLTAIERAIADSGLEGCLHRYQAPAASREQLERVHAPVYVQALFDAAPGQGRLMLEPDTSMNPHTLSAALHAAGANVLAVELVLGGEAASAFCAVRPPGHHAEHDRAMGFCLFNNIAVGAAHALQRDGLERIAIVDFDVHHGNGTEDIFRNDERVLLCSSFQHPHYPFSGADSRSDHILPLPLPAGTTGVAYRRAVEQHWLPAIDAFRPQLLMFSAGFDAHRDDPLAGLLLEEDDYRWLTRQVSELAQRHAGGRMVSTLEGGYALDALGRSVAAHLAALSGST